MTTFHPAPRHHLPELEAMSLLTRDSPRLFFEPGSKCLPADTEHAGNASHAGAFMTCAEYLFLFLFAPARTKMQHRTFVALFAPILLLPLSVMPVLHDVRAVTEAATMGDYFLYHRPMITRHFLISHYQLKYYRWKKIEPLWSLLINFGCLDNMIPVLETLLAEKEKYR